jgi:hypothetical protein
MKEKSAIKIPKNREMFCDPYCMFKVGAFCNYLDGFKRLREVNITVNGDDFGACIPEENCGPNIPKYSIRLFEASLNPILQIACLCRWKPMTIEASKDKGPWVDMETMIYFYRRPMNKLGIFKHMWE